MIAIAAVCENGGIGREGALLFHIREDLRRFRQLTLGKTVVYRQLLPRCSTVYLTRIFAAPQADAFFPDLSRDSAWTKAEQSETFTSGGVSFQYVTYRRK